MSGSSAASGECAAEASELQEEQQPESEQQSPPADFLKEKTLSPPPLCRSQQRMVSSFLCLMLLRTRCEANSHPLDTFSGLLTSPPSLAGGARTATAQVLNTMPCSTVNLTSNVAIRRSRSNAPASRATSTSILGRSTPSREAVGYRMAPLLVTFGNASRRRNDRALWG